MAYFGKVFKKLDKDENFDAFVESLAIPEERRAHMKKSSPTFKLDKNSDGTYSMTIASTDFSATVTFKLGVEFEENIGENVAKTTFTMEGDTLNQVQKFKDGAVVINIKREFSDSAFKLTLTNNLWNGVAYRYYKAE